MASLIVKTFPLGSQWPMFDPFLFCAHHRDEYPAGDGNLAPDASLSGREIGSDFSGLDGWSMYHGSKVPGFPQHPHRGFETISYVRHGLMDHADSLGANARFGRGDVQWMTAGAGVQHSEMFPLTRTDGPNRLEMFQIWLNLPPEDKLVDPSFTMLWGETIPQISGEGSNVTVIAGDMVRAEALSPPPDSWAARADSDVAIWHIVLSPGASWELPPAKHQDTTRALYLFEGSPIGIDDEELASAHGAIIEAQAVAMLTNQGDTDSELLVIQGRPIGAPVAQYGPFVMNTSVEIRQAITDYQRTEFGAWTWPSPDPDHGPDKGRFAVHVDGRLEEPTP